MATSQAAEWQWDAARREYFYWKAHEQCWEYQSGLKIYQQQADESQTPTPQSPRTKPSHQAYQQPQQHGRSMSESSDPGYILSGQLSGLSISGQATQSALEETDQDASHTITSSIHSNQTVGYGYNQESVQRQFADPSTEYIGDPVLVQYGARYAKKYKATPGEEEQLDPRFRIRKPGRNFFKVGKVFKVLWPELAGDHADNLTVVSARYGQSIFTKIRWFVVIREGYTDCSCLPIQTYGGQGVGKKGLRKDHHAIIFTGKPPEPKTKELPKKGEHGMRRSIRVKQHSKSDKLDEMSRLNYLKIYCVEHNVKVYDFGQVHEEYEQLLISNFNDAWGFRAGLPPVPSVPEVPEPEEPSVADTQYSYPYTTNSVAARHPHTIAYPATAGHQGAHHDEEDEDDDERESDDGGEQDDDSDEEEEEEEE